MSPSFAAALAVLSAYFIGAIPFGYLTALWARGIDIRTVGSGNIGATNVGRVLGFRFFLIVFLLDLLKGFLPTYGFPKLVTSFAGEVSGLGVFVALATILGHNFPVYLKFRGGKGVATSLGAFLALDAVASLAAALGFIVFLVVTQYVSLSSLGGGLVFLAVHFTRVDDPWSRGQLVMSIVSIGLVGLLVVRHRKNLARIWARTEPKVSLRKRQRPPEGRIAWVLVVALALVGLGVGYGLTKNAARRSELRLGTLDIVEVARVGTGHQRAERVAFADGGKLLAVTCPRYNRVVLYRVTDAQQLEVVRDIALDGQPVAVWTTRDRLFVLERPAGDARHVKPGWWETFDFRGSPVGTRFPVGMYPDDFVVTRDGRHVLVLTSGRAEGDAARPAPALDVVALEGDAPRIVGRVEFDQPGDDPVRVTVSETGRCAAVSLLGSDQVAAIDLSDRAHPAVVHRTGLSEVEAPHLSVTRDDAILMAVAPERDAVLIASPATSPALGACVAGTLPGQSALVFYDAATRRVLGRLPLLAGSLNLSVTRPLGLAFAPERGLLAVASRSGGVYLIAVRPCAEGGAAPKDLVASQAGSEASPARR